MWLASSASSNRGCVHIVALNSATSAGNRRPCLGTARCLEVLAKTLSVVSLARHIATLLANTCDPHLPQLAPGTGASDRRAGSRKNLESSRCSSVQGALAALAGGVLHVPVDMHKAACSLAALSSPARASLQSRSTRTTLGRSRERSSMAESASKEYYRSDGVRALPATQSHSS